MKTIACVIWSTLTLAAALLMVYMAPVNGLYGPVAASSAALMPVSLYLWAVLGLLKGKLL